ncbi:hypothetical protein M0812_07242 [Anaeramoeba flamelloides]|uniref:Uncharacterized protein n=1 Tax=Anaeramoeba flamelloides TaxID=1746091 RepID=A0AAV8A676_9EUKA|nr:hypothetical protein M0812_07242 [Anaeramoeba flamelloides]
MGICTGIRGRENFNLCVEDVTWGTNTIGDYIEVKQTVTKNDQGTLNCKGAFRKFKRIFSYSSFKYDPYDTFTSSGILDDEGRFFTNHRSSEAYNSY